MKTRIQQSDQTSPILASPRQNRRKRGARALLGVTLAASLSLPGFANGVHRGPARAEVIGSQPIYRTIEVAIPREVCRDERVRQTGWQSAGHDTRYDNRYDSRSSRSRTPGVVGAIIGGALGHSVGRGKTNKRIGTAVGAILGGTIGGDISRRNQQRSVDNERYQDRTVSYRTERVCREETDYRTEQQISGYDVTYVYAGETYTAVLDEDPGRYLDVRVRVNPVSS